MIVLDPDYTKEGHWERVPIHIELFPVLEEVLKVQGLGSDRVFLIYGRAPHPQSVKNAWRRTVPKLGFDGMPRFHDLGHTSPPTKKPG